MKTYIVFKHPISGFQIIKKGFSWPAFFLGLIWLFYSKLWKQSLLYISIIFALFLILPSSNLFIMPLIILVATFLFGIKGNEWKGNNLSEHEFKQIITVNAATPEDAISVAANLPEKVDKDDFNDKWITLINNDPDIKTCVEDLKKYGIKAIENLKNLYKENEEKQQLSTITDKIKKDIEEDVEKKLSLMYQYGISFDNNSYIYHGYRYDRIEDAINYATKLNQ